MKNNLYVIFHLDEEFHNCPWVSAESPEQAFEKVQGKQPFKEYINEEERGLGSLYIYQISMCHDFTVLCFSYNYPDGAWEIDFDERVIR